MIVDWRLRLCIVQPIAVIVYCNRNSARSITSNIFFNLQINVNVGCRLWSHGLASSA